MRYVLLLSALLLASCAAHPSRDGRKGLFQYDTPAPALEESGSCTPLTAVDRARLLALANPSRFPHTRYHRGSGRPLEKETDCSHFVHGIYRRAGLSFSFRSSRNLPDAPEFELLPKRAALPGDLMLFRGHVGIVDSNGYIISATRSRHHRSSITRLPPDAFRPSRLARPVLRYRCRPEGLDRQIAQEK
jgi:hypothetical protein